MRVLIAHNRYRSPGGEERHIELLEQGLREAGLEVARFEPNSESLSDSRAMRAGVAITLSYRPSAGGIRSVLTEWKPDVVHFHNLWPLLTPAALRAANRAGARVVLTAHNCRFACPGGTCSVDAHPATHGVLVNTCLKGSSLRCALRKNPRGVLSESVAYGAALEIQRRGKMLARWVDAFIAPSRYIAQMLELAGIPGGLVHLVPHGVVSVRTVTRRNRYALYAGRLSLEKGVRTLLAAARLAPEVPVAFAGTGPLVDEVRRSKAQHLGYLSSEGLANALDEASFSVVPSECHENLPYGVLESFAAARPVVATKVGGLPEVVQDEVTGLLVPPREPKILADAMRRLWGSPDLSAALGTRAAKLARSEFSFARQIEQTIAVYEGKRSRNFATGARRRA